MEREERIRHQKEFLIKFAYWAVWGGLVLAAVKMIGPVLLPFIAAFLWRGFFRFRWRLRRNACI